MVMEEEEEEEGDEGMRMGGAGGKEKGSKNSNLYIAAAISSCW